MLNFTHRSVLRDGEPGAAGGTGAPGGQPNPGTGSLDPAKFVSVEDFGKTAAMIRGIQKSLETITGAALTADRLAELGLLEKADDGTFRARAAGPTPKGAPPADDPVKRDLDQLKAQLKAKDEEIATEKRKAAEAERNRAVVAAMAKAGAVNAERDHVHLAAAVVRAEDGQYVARTKGKYGEDVDVPVEEFVSGWLKANPDLMKAQGGTGTGTLPGQGARGGHNGNVVPKTTWSDMTWYMQNREKIQRGELVLGD